MLPEVRLLLILDPSEAFNLSASWLKINEVTVMMDKRWKVHLISSQTAHYDNLTCDYQVHKVRMLSNPNSIPSRILYLTLAAYVGAKLVKKYNINAVMAKEGHLTQGLVDCAIKSITKTKCIVRVNENSVLELLLFLERLKTPVLSTKTFMRIIELIARRVEAFVFKHADWVVTQGPMDFQRIKKVTEKVSFVPLWIDTQKFRPLDGTRKHELRKKLIEVDDETKVVLFVGRLHLEKDIDTLFKAFEKLLETRNNAELVLIGTGPEEENCKELARKLAITSKVRFLGYVPHEKMPDYYNAADVYVLTSIWEELSNTIMEAMACGLPVIATNVGGNPYLVKDQVTGFLVSAKNPEALSERIAYALDHAEECKKVSLKARLEIEKYGKERGGELYKTVINRVISHKQNRLLSVA